MIKVTNEENYEIIFPEIEDLQSFDLDFSGRYCDIAKDSEREISKVDFEIHQLSFSEICKVFASKKGEA